MENNMRDFESLRRLEKILSTMDVPWNRKKDLNPIKLRWLNKNLVERNASHKDYAEAMGLIQKLIADG
jgi:hypothetical protein